MSIGSINDSFASSIAFSALPPMPTPSMPGGHHPAPISGTTSTTQSATESEGFNMANTDLFSEPPPLAATVISTRSPGTSPMWITAGVLSRVLERLPAGSATIEARSLLLGIQVGTPTPSLIMRSRSRVVSQRTPMPTLTNTTTMPVSWQIGPMTLGAQA